MKNNKACGILIFKSCNAYKHRVTIYKMLKRVYASATLSHCFLLP